MYYGPVEELILGSGKDQDAIVSEQYLSDAFWADLQDAKDDFHFRLNGLTPVASIPETVVNKWLREGFDFYNAPANEITKKLRLESMDAFIISGDKRFDH